MLENRVQNRGFRWHKQEIWQTAISMLWAVANVVVGACSASSGSAKTLQSNKWPRIAVLIAILIFSLQAVGAAQDTVKLSAAGPDTLFRQSGFELYEGIDAIPEEFHHIFDTPTNRVFLTRGIFDWIQGYEKQTPKVTGCLDGYIPGVFQDNQYLTGTIIPCGHNDTAEDFQLQGRSFSFTYKDHGFDNQEFSSSRYVYSGRLSSDARTLESITVERFRLDRRKIGEDPKDGYEIFECRHVYSFQDLPLNDLGRFYKNGIRMHYAVSTGNINKHLTHYEDCYDSFTPQSRQDEKLNVGFSLYVAYDQMPTMPDPVLLQGRLVADAASHVSDWLGAVPLPYMPVVLTVRDHADKVLLESAAVTDADGKYKIFVRQDDLEKLKNEPQGDIADIFPLAVELTIKYEYWRDEVKYFGVQYKKDKDSPGIIPEMTLSVQITGLEMKYDIDVWQWIVNPKIDLSTPAISTGSAAREYLHFTPVYFHTHEAVEFALNQLKMGKELAKLIVEVGGNEGTHYDSNIKTVRIDKNDLHYPSVDRPKNREYHEFAHHIMFVQYGNKWPRDWLRLGFFPKVVGNEFVPSSPGVTHAASRWQIRHWVDRRGYETVWDSGEQWANLTTITFPAFNTDPKDKHYREPFADLQYHWRVLHLDSKGDWTEHPHYLLGDKIGDISHDGYINPSTADSYLEGFAEFMALLISKYRTHNPDPKPHIYAKHGSMYNWWKPWDKEGKDEEFAVCGVLWKLYDLLPDLGLNEMWEILKVNRANFFEYYKTFNETHPDLEIFIEAIFALHGFFGDQQIGDMEYNSGEARRSINSGFYFVDYGTPAGQGFPGMKYDYGDTVGQATNYERPWRYSAGHHPQSYLQVNDTQVRLYRVQVSFAGNQDAYVYQRGPGSQKVEFPPDQDYEYLTELRSGVLAIQLPPADTRATITIIPKSRDYTAANAYTIDNQQAYAKLYQAGQGFFDRHTFNLTPTGTSLDPPHELIEGVEPVYRVTDLGRPQPEQDPTLEYTISVAASPLAGGTVQGGGRFHHGQPVYLLAIASAGYVFQNWTENGRVVSSHAGLSFNAGADRNLVANFIPVPLKYTVTATARAGGSVMPSSRTVDHGDGVTFGVNPDPGYRHGSVGGTCPAGSFQGHTYTTGPITFDCTVIFNFIQTQQFGSLRVIIEPAGARNAGAQWRRVGTQTWRNSGTTENNVPVGAQNVEFKDVSGWIRPGNASVTVVAGQTATATGTYTQRPQTGSLRVTIEPAGARDAGAQWRRVGTTTWRNSGTTESNVPTGVQTVEFKDVSGWSRPGNVSVTVVAGQTAAATGMYTLSAELAAGGWHSLGIDPSDRAVAWGSNSGGRLGDGTTTERHKPVLVSGLTNAAAVSAGRYHSLALKRDGTVWAWGSNLGGQLGDGTTTERHRPVQVSGLTDVVGISAGCWYSLAVKSDGTVWAWGSNTNGQLGDGTTTERHRPVRVSGLTMILEISAGSWHSLAVKSDGTVWAWGGNANGQLGDGTTTERHQPVQVSGLSKAAKVSAGQYHSLAAGRDGNLWAWGSNVNGRLGDGTTTDRHRPVKVSNLTNVEQISAGGWHSLAVKSDGTAWAWGTNSNGRLGDGTQTHRHAPVRVSGLTNVAMVSAGRYHSLGLQADGTAWAWGFNGNGQLGDGTTTERHRALSVSTLRGPRLDNVCPGCTGDVVVLQGMRFPTGTDCECSAGTSITIGPNVTIENGATIHFTAPKIDIRPGVTIQPGANVHMRRE